MRSWAVFNRFMELRPIGRKDMKWNGGDESGMRIP